MPTFDQLLTTLTFIAAIGCGLIAGVFYAFSTFIMKALRRRPAAEGMAAMQAINVAVINPMFLGVFLGTAGVCAVTMIAAIVRWETPRGFYVLGGGMLYVVGTFLVTMVGKVPLNNALAPLNPFDPENVPHWANYVRRWTAWNHVRTAAALTAAGLLTIALCID